MTDRFPQLLADQFAYIKIHGPNSTRSKAIIEPTHKEIANIIQDNLPAGYSIALEKEFIGLYGSKKIDIAIIKDNKIIAAIFFKAMRANYNKNANNRFDEMRGESDLFLDSNIPVYQIAFIPTVIKKDNSWENPTEKSFNNYCNFIKQLSSPRWKNLKVGTYYFDVDYVNFTAKYSSEKIIPEIEPTLTEGLINFIKTYI